VSKYMQVDIRIVPFYEESFTRSFPNLTAMLRQMAHEVLAEGDTSFYEMADHLEAIMDNPGTPSRLREQVRPYVKRIMELKETAREHFLARRLNELDRVLYQMEDQFTDLEAAL